MADEKSLKIGVKGDSKDLKSFANAFNDLKKVLDNINKSLIGFNKAIKDLDKGFLGTIKDLDKFKKSFSDTNKLFSDNSKGAEQYTKSLDKLANVASGKTPGGGNRGGAANSLVSSLRGMVNGMQIVPQPGGGFVVVPGAGGGGTTTPGGGGTASSGGGQGFNGRPYRAAEQWAAVGGGMADVFQQMKLAPLVNSATSQQLRGNLIREMLGGDFSSAMALNRMRTNGINPLEQFGGQGALKFKNIFGGAGSVAGAAASGNFSTALAGGAQGIGGAIVPGIGGGMHAQEAQALMQGIETEKGINPFQTIMAQQLAATAGVRLQGNRRLNNGAIKAAGLGIGQGMNLGESVGFFTGGANQFGAETMMGERAMQRPMVNAAGRRTGTENVPALRGLGERALGFQSFGFERDLMTQLMGGMQAFAGGNRQERLDKTEKVFTEAVSTGIREGITDVQTLETLARAIGEASTGPTGSKQTAQLATFLTAGMTSESANPQLIQARMAGLQGLSSGLAANPFFQASQRAMAKSATGGSALQTDVLGGASLLDLMSGKNKEINALFGDQKGQALVQQQISGRIGLIRDVITSGTGPEAQALREGITKYGSFEKAVSIDPHLRDIAVASARHQIGGMPGFEELSQVFQGLGAEGGPEKGNLLGRMGRKGGLEMGQLSTAANIEFKTMLEELKPEQVEIFKKTFETASASFKTLATLPSAGLDDAVKVVAAITHLIEAAGANPGVDKKVRAAENQVKTQGKK